MMTRNALRRLRRDLLGDARPKLFSPRRAGDPGPLARRVARRHVETTAGSVLARPGSIAEPSDDETTTQA
jgi:hypothetical protein